MPLHCIALHYILLKRLRLSLILLECSSNSQPSFQSLLALCLLLRRLIAGYAPSFGGVHLVGQTEDLVRERFIKLHPEVSGRARAAQWQC